MKKEEESKSPVCETKATFSERIYRLSSIFHRIWTIIRYRPFFHSLGPRSRIIHPMLMVNTEFADIGTGVTIRNGARIECVRTPGCAAPHLSIGNFTNIEQNVHIICRSRVRIGNYVTITGNCVIVDVHHPYEDIEDIRRIGLRIDNTDRPVEIGDYTFLGMHSIILPGVRIGKHCVVAAASVVTSDVPDYCVVAGQPARIVKRYNPATRKWEREVSSKRKANL